MKKARSKKRIRVTMSVDRDIYTQFRRTCLILDTKMSRIIDQYIKMFVEEYKIE